MTRAYGSAGRFGVGAPQSNPTVEAEFAILAPRTATLYATRLTSTAATPEERLRFYLENLPATLAGYDNMKLDAFAFACTGSSYLLGAAREQEMVKTLSEQMGYPVLTAAQAIVWMLQRLGARKIAMIAPYSEALLAEGEAYFAKEGFEVVSINRVVTRTTDTRTIYELTADQAQTALSEANVAGADAILVSGTGMPSLPVVNPRGATPIISSNYCLGLRMLHASGRASLLDADGLEPLGWRKRLAEALGMDPV